MNNLKLAAEALKESQRKEIDNTILAATSASETLAKAGIQSRSWYVQDDADNLKQIVKQERKRLGWTQRELARKADMSQGSITRAEKHGWVSYYAWIKIAHALGKQLTIK